MEKIIEGIKGEIAHAESLKEQYPKMDSQDVINLLQKIVDLLESESPEPEGELPECPWGGDCDVSTRKGGKAYCERMAGICEG